MPGGRGASTASRSRARGRWPGARPARPPFLAEPLPPRERGPVELDDLVRFVEHPVRAFLRQRLGVERRRLLATRSPTRCRSSSTASSSGASASGCCGAPGSARIGARTAIRAEIARGTLPPGELGRAGDRRRSGRSSTRSRQQARDADRRRRAGARSTSASTLAGGRALSGTVPGVRGDVLRTRHLLAGRPAPPARRRGCGCSRCAPRPAAVRRRSRSAARGRRARRDVGDGRADPARPSDARRAARRSWSTSATAGCASRCRSPAGRRRRYAARRRTRAARVGVGPLRRRRTATPSTCSSRRRAAVRRAAGADAARRTSAGTPASRRASAGTRGACGRAAGAPRR